MTPNQITEEKAMTRDEHLAWCKQRALEYLPANPAQAVASMTSDLNKHEDFRTPSIQSLTMLGMFAVMDGPIATREWIEGFR